jgi:hypothetical protein
MDTFDHDGLSRWSWFLSHVGPESQRLVLEQKGEIRLIFSPPPNTHPQMPINASNALTLAHQLRVYTAEAASFSDMMDVVYVAQMIQKFLGYVDQIKEVRFSISFGASSSHLKPHAESQIPPLPLVTALPPSLPPSAGGGDGGHGQQPDAGG